MRSNPRAPVSSSSLRSAAAVLAIAAVCALPCAAEELGFPPDRLPPGWEILEVVEIDRGQLDAFETKLGGQIEAANNTLLSVGGIEYRVNFIECSSEEDAEAVRQGVLLNRPADFAVREGVRVVEFTGRNPLIAKPVRAALGHASTTPREWKLGFRAGTVVELEHHDGNRVFNLFIQRGNRPEDERLEKEIREKTKYWIMGDFLRLRTAPHPGFEAEFVFEPETIGRDFGPGEEPPSGNATFFFQDLPTDAGVPWVKVKATVRVTDRFEPAPGPASEVTLAATPFWPKDDPELVQLAESLAGGAETDAERVRAILRWVWGEIRFDGPTKGSRYGVEKVLEQRFGHCWDKSDVFVTLCRAAGVHARQVAGWVPHMRSGHVWAEVHVDGGWLPVDPTTPWLGISDDYIPYFLTEDGHMPIVYLGMPRVVETTGR